MKKIIFIIFLVNLTLSAIAQKERVYNKVARQNAIYEDVKSESGENYKVKVEVDKHGNAEGSQYDLAVDGAFEGETIAVLQLYTGEGFDFSLPKAALKEKGFSVYRWLNRPPSPEKLKEGLDKSCQLWIISNTSQMLTKEHIKVIKEFFDAGHGIYIWGDNAPYYADANYVARALFDVEMTGNLMGNKVVNLKSDKNKSGIIPNHLISTGIEHVYEGVTIATIQPNNLVKPLIYGSEGNLVAVYFEQDGKRAIIDGGFTRLYIAWDKAGTGRYVKNAAAWLVNYERFGEFEPAGN